MSTFKIKIANLFAMQSCPAWQSNRAIRKICRKAYRFLMEFGAMEYPYADTNFANWPESDSDEFYTLVTDSDNFVIRRSTSYIAWMIRRHCGKWPKLPTPGEREPGEHHFDAKHWDEVLEFNGWTRDKLGPGMPDAINKTRFIGIIPEEGEFGQLVWFMRVDMDYDIECEVEYVRSWHVASYRDFKWVHYFIPVSDEENIIWYREPTRRKSRLLL